MAVGDRLDQSVYGELAVLVMLVWRPESLDPAGYAVGVTKSALRQPDSTAKILASDLAVLADAQRGPAGHWLLLA
ncbi:hypothetical protein [Mycobacteroides salmoniphilum]|uniref:hypothetical protein n=1 Tax=Mycobacteroides salmoniphilum TaxID=404941 RepID=UPI001F3B4CFF|nr:hypothetical protein [Mycobacteroides salmoniphilum]